MLIPSIDLMGGKIVQLVQGEKKALEFDDFEEWILRFSKFPLVQLIDLDAAIGKGDNGSLLRQFTERLPCRPIAEQSSRWRRPDPGIRRARARRTGSRRCGSSAQTAPGAML